MNDFKKRHHKSRYSRGQWSVQRERFGIPPGRTVPDDGNIVQLSSLLNLVLRTIEKSDAMSANTLEEGWDQIVGKPFAGKTRPGHLHENILVVFVRDTVWLHAVRYQLNKEKLLEKIRKLNGCGGISSLKFELDPGPGAGKK